MNSEARFSARVLSLASALVVLGSCSSERVQEPSLELSVAALHNAPIPDAPDSVWLTRAANALLGRPPIDAEERNALNGVLSAGGRTALIDHLTAGAYEDEYVRHWSSLLLDVFRVYRVGGSIDRSNAACWNSSTLNALQQTGAAEHVAAQPTSSAWPGGAFTMRDVVEGSIRADDLRAPLRANLFAQLSTPLAGNQVSEPNIRADLWTRFESAYLNRQVLCLSCHNNGFSVTGTASDWDRHAPLPDLLERAVFGSSHAGNVIPPDLHADFRHNGVASGTLAPWGMQGCGQYDSTPSPQTPEGGYTCPATPPEVILATAPNDTAALADPCYVVNPAAPSVRSAPQPAFAQRGGVGSVFRLDQLLANGMASMAGSGLAAIPPDPASGENTREVDPAGTGEGAERAFAIMVAANIAERVWEEVFGSRLTLAHYIPRLNESRNVLHMLTQTVLRGPTGDAWSLRLLLRTILLRPEFNAATAIGAPDADEYPMERLFDPWVATDPRPAPVESERCSSANPTYEGCVRGLMRLYRCVNCHENEELYPRFDHSDLADVQSYRVTRDRCEELKTSPSCAADIDCARITTGADGKPASAIALRVSCTNESARMPWKLAPMARTDIEAIVKWVEAGSPEGTRGPPPPLPPDTTTNQVSHNGVGDRISWKSPYQLTATVGTALDLAPWSSGPFPSASGYPNRDVAEAAGHHLLQSIPGGRGMSILSLLRWESAHQATSSAPCQVGSGADRIEELVALARSGGQSVERILSDLKQSMLGESALGTGDSDPGGERSLLETVLSGPALSDVVTAGNADAVEAGLRRVCRVWLKSPLLLLAYLEPPGVGASTAPMIAARGTDADALDDDDALTNLGSTFGERSRWPALCADRLDCRPYAPVLEQVLVGCSSQRSSCSGAGGATVTRQVSEALRVLRLPVAPPALTYSRALSEAPYLVPSAQDPRMKSPLLVLPLAGGRVDDARGGIEALRDGRFRRLRRGDTIVFGEVLFIDAYAHLTVRSGNVTYRTSWLGMESPPRDDETHPRGIAHGHRRSNSWIVVANGPEATVGPPVSFDPTIPLGRPHPVVSDPPPLVGVQPAWAVYGEGGLWYSGAVR